MAVLVPDRALTIRVGRVAGCATAGGAAPETCRNRTACVGRMSVVGLDVVVAA